MPRGSEISLQRVDLAVRLVERIERLGLDQAQPDGCLRNKPDRFVAAEGVLRDGSLLHMSALNAAHELVLAA